jgi:hypothetical protein
MARRNKPEDSLDLLLDTMCNAFGGIIMIAILVALLAKDPAPAEADASQTALASIVQRQLRSTRDELGAAQQLQEALARQLQQTNVATKLADERDELARQLGGFTASAPDQPEVKARKDELRRRTATVQSEVAELEAKEVKLTRELGELDRAIKEAQAQRTIELGPPPTEQATQKSPLNLIFRHNRLYPLMVLGPGGAVRNEATVKWNEILRGPSDVMSVEVEPIPGAGIDVEKNEAALRDFIAMLRKLKSGLAAGSDFYLASYVYKDSFPAYLRFKKLFAQANTGIDQGWEPVPNEDNLKFGQSGFKPPKQ